MKFEVIVEGQFSSAHFLTRYQGGPEPLHGHNWKAQVVVVGERLNADEYLVDFCDLKAALDEILKRWDHRCLNELPDFSGESPSAETVAVVLYNQLTVRWQDSHGRIQSVGIWETPDSGVRYSP